MRRAGRALFLGLLFVATLEVCTRVEAWWRWDAPFWGPYSSEMLRTTDEIGTRNRPGRPVREVGHQQRRIPRTGAPRREGPRCRAGGRRRGFGGLRPLREPGQGRHRTAASAAVGFRSGSLRGREPGLGRDHSAAHARALRALGGSLRASTSSWSIRRPPSISTSSRRRARRADRAAARSVRRPARLLAAAAGQALEGARELLPAGLQAWLKRVAGRAACGGRTRPSWVWSAAPPRAGGALRDRHARARAVDRASGASRDPGDPREPLRVAASLRRRGAACSAGSASTRARRRSAWSTWSRQANEAIRRLGSEHGLRGRGRPGGAREGPAVLRRLLALHRRGSGAGGGRSRRGGPVPRDPRDAP